MARLKSKAKVILMHNLAKKGKFGDFIEVKKGYAKNFLIPKGIAIPAIKENINKFETLKKESALKAEKLKSEALIISDRINAMDIIVNANAGQDGKIFGSISSKNIIEQINLIDPSMDIDKNKIFINVPIKYIGEHLIQFNLNPDVILVKKIKVLNINSSNNQNIAQDDDSEIGGYDYSGQVRSGDKKFDYLEKEDY
jgi:large subunit ribosomal protein L9